MFGLGQSGQAVQKLSKLFTAVQSGSGLFKGFSKVLKGVHGREGESLPRTRGDPFFANPMSMVNPGTIPKDWNN